MALTWEGRAAKLNGATCSCGRLEDDRVSLMASVYLCPSVNLKTVRGSVLTILDRWVPPIICTLNFCFESSYRGEGVALVLVLDMITVL